MNLAEVIQEIEIIFSLVPTIEEKIEIARVCPLWYDVLLASQKFLTFNLIKKFADASYWPHTSDIVRQREVIKNAKAVRKLKL